MPLYFRALPPFIPWQNTFPMSPVGLSKVRGTRNTRSGGLSRSETNPISDIARSRSDRRQAHRKLSRYDMGDPLDELNGPYGLYSRSYKTSPQSPPADMRMTRYGY